MPRLKVEVVLALPARQRVVPLELPDGACAADAVRASGIDAPARGALGVGGRRVDGDYRLQDGDRVEILRPLARGPGEQRRERARAAARRRR